MLTYKSKTTVLYWLALLSVTALTLTGCGSQSRTSSTQQTEATVTIATPYQTDTNRQSEIDHSSSAPVASIDDTSTESANNLHFIDHIEIVGKNALPLWLAQQYYHQDNYRHALSILDTVDYKRLSIAQRYIYGMLQAASYHALHDYPQALNALSLAIHIDPPTVLSMPTIETQLHRFSPIQQSQWLSLRGACLHQLERYDEAAYQLFLRHRLLSSPLAIANNYVRLWANLNQIWATDFTQLKVQYPHPEFVGWLTLAQINADSYYGVEGQWQHYLDWRKQYPDHPANHTPPTSINHIAQWRQHLPQRIGLMLPLTGSFSVAGQALRDGFLATYYSLIEQYDELPDLFFYDTATETGQSSIDNLYAQAQADRVDLIIGPLHKHQVTEIMNLSPSIPVLALNVPTDTQTKHPQIKIFTFTISDEIKQIVRAMRIQNHRRILAIGVDNDWGHRNIGTLTQYWHTDSSYQVVDSHYLSKKSNYKEQLADLLAIDESQQRHKGLRQIIGQDLHYTPYRRKDIDAIFIALHPQDLRQIKPLLAFLFADDIPVYATSSGYSGTMSSDTNNDINGIYSITLPWLLEDNMIKRILTQDSQFNVAQTQFYAMGSDAFYLSQRLHTVGNDTGDVYHGAVGNLTLEADQRFHRRQVWIHFVNGVAQRLMQR